MSCKEGILSDHKVETALIDPGELRSIFGNDGGRPGGLVDQGQLADDGAAGGVFDSLASHNDIQRAFEKDVHAISGFTFAEKDLSRSETRCVRVVGEKVGWIQGVLQGQSAQSLNLGA